MLTTLLDVVVLSAGLLAPGWCLLRLLNLRPLSLALAVPASAAASLGIVALGTTVAWVLRTGLRGAEGLSVAIAAGVIVAAILRRRHLTPLDRPGRLELAAAAVAAVTAGLALFDGVWLSQDADTFYHLAAALGLLRTQDALPYDVFFGVAIPYPDATVGSLHDLLAWLSTIGGMLPAWSALTVVGAVFTGMAFLAFSREVTRSTPVAVVATGLYLVLELALDMRTAGYPNRIAPGIVWLAFAFVIRYARPETRSRGELVLAGLMAFGAGMVHSGMAPTVVLMSGTTVVAAAAVVVLRRRSWGSLRPVVVACAAVALVTVPVLALRLLGLPTPGPEGSFAIEAPPLKLHTILGYTFIDFRFWFDSFVGVASLGTLCLLGRARRELESGDSGAALLWGGILFTPLSCFVPFIASAPADQLYYYARVVGFLSPLLYIPLGWELWSLVPLVLKWIWADHERKEAPVTFSAARQLTAAALIIGMLYTGAANLHAGVYQRYFANTQFTVAASHANDLTKRWADRLSALQGAGPGAVLADLHISYELAGLTGRRVVAVPYSHTPFQIEPRDGILRRGDVADALSPTSDPFTLPSVLLRYDVTYVLVDQAMDGQDTWDWIGTQGELTVVAQGPGWKLLKFDQSLLDGTLDIAMANGVGEAPAEVEAGRYAFVRIAPAGQAGTARVTATGLASGATYSTQIAVGAIGGPSVTTPLEIPDGAPVDRYSVSVDLPGTGQVAAGDFVVGRTYEAESFANVVDFFNGGYYSRPAWISTYDPKYSRGAAAIGLRTGVAASHPLSDPLGDYCVALQVAAGGSGETLSLTVAMGSSSVSFEWSDTGGGVRELRQPLDSTSGAHTLTFWVPAGGTVPVAVDRITLYPPPLAGSLAATC